MFEMGSERLPGWLQALGYDGAEASLHQSGDAIDAAHPYASELGDLLRPDGQIRAQAVFDVQGFPTVVFFEDDGTLLQSREQLDRIRQRIWNQNLISIVMVVNEDGLIAFPLDRKGKPSKELKLSDASLYGPMSAADVRSNEIRQRFPEWFKKESRVDRQLLKNLGATIELLIDAGHEKEIAQTLMGQALFISYLEHRGIVSETYRGRRKVDAFQSLVASNDLAGIKKLIAKLRGDFNGDFLSPDKDTGELWDHVNAEAFPILSNFLKRVDASSGQQSFWNYDFSYIPVELLSGIYETFIGDERHATGAYYTPRALAVLVVDQVFASSKDPLGEYIYDGACGSGILLTTAFRRMVGFAEARINRQLTLTERIDLLKERIFGSDLNKSACKVTAFSLYLSLLENLKPSDVLALQENENVKLPPLKHNLVSGEILGDFFSPSNPFASKPRFSLLISNPPWREPDGDERTTADVYAEKTSRVTRTHRQMAADFAFRAADCLIEGGRICLITPGSLFLAPSSQEFVRGWALSNRIHQIINFGDLKEFLFDDAEHSCLVVTASPRRHDANGIPPDEMIDYWAPKCDTSLAFGRLTLASGDRHAVQAQAVASDCSRLVTLMWGNEADLALLRRLRRLGTFEEMTGGKKPRWIRRKGMHRFDAHVKVPVSTKSLRNHPFVEIGALKRGLPIVLTEDLIPFPAELKEVAKLSDELLSTFEGPRILFPDGASTGLEIRACYLDARASFTSSVGVIAGTVQDADLLRFAAAYLRSDLIKYYLAMSAYQIVIDRPKVTLENVGTFPFVAPESHPNPKLAKAVLKKVAKLLATLEPKNVLRAVDEFSSVRDGLNDLVFDYFELTDAEKLLVQETVTEIVPSIKPRGFSSLYTKLQQRTDSTQMASYAAALELELLDWQRELDGKGGLAVEVVAMDSHNAGAFGVVRVDLRSGNEKAKILEDNQAVKKVLDELRNRQLLPMSVTEDMYFSPDAIIWTDRSLYLIRPLIRRFWLRHTAVRDARSIVLSIHEASPKKGARE